MRVSQKKYCVFPIQFATVSHTFVGKILQKYARISRTFLSDILWGQILYAYLSSLNWPFHRALKWTCPAGHLKHPIKSKSGLKYLKIYHVTQKCLKIPLHTIWSIFFLSSVCLEEIKMLRIYVKIAHHVKLHSCFSLF